MKIEKVVTLELFDYFNEDKFLFVCLDFIKTIIGSSPRHIRITVSDTPEPGLKRFVFLGVGYGRIRSPHQKPRELYIYRSARMWIKNGFGLCNLKTTDKKVLYFKVEACLTLAELNWLSAEREKLLVQVA